MEKPMPVSPELYKKYKTVVLEYSNAVHDSRRRALTNAESAENGSGDEVEEPELSEN